MLKRVRFILLLSVTLFSSVKMALPSCEKNKLSIISSGFNTIFDVEIANTPTKRAKGLMYREFLGTSSGMLFMYDKPGQLNFWMKNTPLSLDIIFFDKKGLIRSIYENAEPFSDKLIFGGNDLIGAIEINGGLTSKLGIAEGDSIQTSGLNNKTTLWPCTK